MLFLFCWFIAETVSSKICMIYLWSHPVSSLYPGTGMGVGCFVELAADVERGRVPPWGLHCSTGVLQHRCGQWLRHLEGCGWEQQLAWFEPKWCFVIWLLCWSWIITITMFKHRDAHQCICYQSTVCQRSMIEFVVISSDLQPLCLRHSGKDRSRAVDWSPPIGELDQMAGEAAGRIWQT